MAETAMMRPEDAAVPPGFAMRWSVPVSVLFHALLAAAMLVAWQNAQNSFLPPEQNIPVEWVTEQQFAALLPRQMPPPADQTLPTEVAPVTAPSPEMSRPEPQPTMIRATAMLSAKALAEPRSKQARETLPLLDDTEQMVQLCDLEAMEQVEQWQPNYRPERVVAYARSELAIAGRTVAADGAAFRSKGAWYDLRFECTLSDDSKTVVGFRFLVGDPIPPDDWERLLLPPVE